METASSVSLAVSADAVSYFPLALALVLIDRILPLPTSSAYSNASGREKPVDEGRLVRLYRALAAHCPAAEHAAISNTNDLAT